MNEYSFAKRCIYLYEFYLYNTQIISDMKQFASLIFFYYFCNQLVL